MNGITLCTGQRYPHSFTLDDLGVFEDFVAEHSMCMWYSDVASEDEVDTNAIAIRHDVDHSIIHAHRFAQWEAEHGINASYYILPTAPYYRKEDTTAIALEMQAMGHEIGVHNDAHCEAARKAVAAGTSGFDAVDIARIALDILYGWVDDLRQVGLNITGCADHGGGDPANVDMWKLRGGPYVPEDADLRYECYALHARGANYISDNRGTWRARVERVEGKQTHVLIHPEHWRLP